MRPFSDINIGDVYKQPFGQLEWVVLNKNKEEKMIEIVSLSNLPSNLNKPFWKKNTDRLFTNRLLEGPKLS